MPIHDYHNYAHFIVNRPTTYRDTMNEWMQRPVRMPPQQQQPRMDSGYFFAPFVPLTRTPDIDGGREFSREEWAEYNAQQDAIFAASMVGFRRIDDDIEFFEDSIVEKLEPVNWLKDGF